MKTKLIVLCTFLFLNAQYSSSQLIISEYLEGPSNNKCIEIYNPTGSPVNLTTYTLELYFNGSTSPNVIDLTGIISSCGTHVICNSSASQAGIADQTAAALNFNGDDAVGLYNGGTLIDLFGNIGNDPGSEWTGVGAGTQNDGFIRNENYCSGVTSNPGGTGANSFTTFNSTNWTSVGESGFTLGSHSSSCGACSNATNTITIVSISNLLFDIDCSTGGNGTVDITSTESFNALNEYTVQLSDETGSFNAPVTIGSLNSAANAASINFTIPPGTATGSAYRIRIVSTNPSATSTDNGSDITINLTGSCDPPHITSIIINSCDPTCSEGYNELVFGNSGDYSFSATAPLFNFNYGSNPPPGVNTNYTDILVNNTTRTNELNVAAGCPGLFVDATNTTVPAGANWMLAYTDICEEALTWSGLCGSGPIYVIFQDDPHWNTGGNFANNTSTMRFVQSSITTTSGETFTINYNFDGTQYANSDGAFVTYSSNGGAPISYEDDDCILDPTVLPVDVIAFNGQEINGEVLLSWFTLSEYNFSQFILSHSTTGYDFNHLDNIPSIGHSNQTIKYRSIHEKPTPGVNYYNLKAQDIDGTVRNHGTIAVEINSNFAYYNTQKQYIQLSEEYEVEIYDLTGKLITFSENKNTIPFNYKGVFLIRENKSGLVQKLVIY